MGTRIRVNPDHVYEVFCEVAIPTTITEEPFILTKYPESFNDNEIIKSIASFSCPVFPMRVESVLHFSFVLTGGDSKWTFGFVRHSKSPPASTCLVILSSLPWHDSFYKILNYIHSLTNRDKESTLFVNRFLESLHQMDIPEVGLSLNVSFVVNHKEYEFSAPCPDHHKLPSIPEDRNLTEYFNAIDTTNMIILFASMLNERRIVMTSRRLSRLSACIQSANNLIYPMHWQHIFIPVLPRHLLDYLSAPMPFLIGVPSDTMARVKRHELGDIVLLDADENRVDSPFDDIHMLPTDVISFLKKNLRSQNNVLLGDAISRTFLKALVMLIGGYRDALSFPPGQRITFNKEQFVNSRPLPIQPFLERMLQLQIFQQFIEGRLSMLHEGQGFNDEFEFELNLHEDKSSNSVNRLKSQYNEWLTEIKKESSAILKTVNPAMKSAYRQVRNTGRQVKDKSKQAYRGIRSRIQQKVNNSNITGSIQKPSRPRSAPSSPNTSPTASRRSEWLTTTRLNPTGGSSSSVPGVKKSISGVIVEKTDRAATYIRPTTLHNGHTRNGLFFDLPTPKSSHSSDDNVNNQQPMSNMDLLSELSEIFTKKCSSTFDPFSPTMTTNPSSSNPFDQLDHQQSSTKQPIKTDLISLTTPPEDLAAIFDPLRDVTNNRVHVGQEVVQSHQHQINTLMPSSNSNSCFDNNFSVPSTSSTNGNVKTPRPKGFVLPPPPPLLPKPTFLTTNHRGQAVATELTNKSSPSTNPFNDLTSPTEIRSWTQFE